MSSDRINEFITLDKAKISELMSAYFPKIDVIEFVPLTESMGNTGYKVTTNIGIYLLKLFSTPRYGIECAMYQYLNGKVHVPELLFYDFSKTKIPNSYCIIDFIESVSLADYIRSNNCFPAKLAYDIGVMCATIHQKKYSHSASLNEQLKMTRRRPITYWKILYMLHGKPAKYLHHETVIKLAKFIHANRKLLKRLDHECVLCHGDFHCWNILVSNNKAYCIDFEYAYAGSRYNDIGHFFRRKGDDIQCHINDEVYSAFEEGYNSISELVLPPDWLRLARLCDIHAMLGLFNNDHFPEEWISDIERDILTDIQ